MRRLLPVLILAVLSGCATTPPPRPAPLAVNADMAAAANRIAAHLDTLVILDQGIQPARHPGPIGLTVAGNPPASPPLVVPGAPASAPADLVATPDASRVVARLALQTRIALNWSGNPVDLARAMAARIDYTVEVAPGLNAAAWPDVAVRSHNASVEWVLREISRGLGDRASIEVVVPSRTIRFVPVTATGA